MVLNLKNLLNWGGDNQSYCKLWAVPGASATRDISGNGKTITDSTITYGKVKSGANRAIFNGSSGSQSYADSDDWDLGSGDFSWCWWEYCVAATSETASILREDTTGYMHYMLGYKDGTKASVYMSSALSSWDVHDGSKFFSSAVPLSTWVFYCVTRSGSTFSMYQNATLSDTFTSSATFGTDAVAMSIGKHGTYYFNGSLKDVMFFKGIALTAGQIKALYDATYIA